MKVLLVEDEQKLVDSLSYLLKKNGFVVDAATDGETGIEMACTGIYDLIILDWLLPMKDGMSVIKEFRSLGHSTPVLFLSAKDSPENRAEGLTAGADDYLVKPFYTVELLARLQALARRRGQKLEENLLSVDDIVFNPMNCQVTKNGQVINLTLKEAQLLELLLRNYNRVVTKEQIIQKVWGYYSDVQFTVINLYIHYLRKKLDLSNLKTVWGVGYSLHSPNETKADEKAVM